MDGHTPAEGSDAPLGEVESSSPASRKSSEYSVPSKGEPDVLVPADSTTRPAISVVLPTLNEEEGIDECIEQILTALRRLAVAGEIIVSDSSDDRTPEIARRMGAIVVKPDRPGYGYAYRYAFQFARGDYVVIGDADTTYDFEELPKLYDLVARGEAEMAIGSRLEGEIKDGAMPWLHRYIGNPLLTRFLNAFYDAGVSDAHSGFRVISRETLQDLELRSDGMEFASEMIMQAAENGHRIEERPITYHPRKGDATLDSLPDGWRHVKFMLVNAPGYLYLTPGAGLFGIGTLLVGCAVAGLRLGRFTPETYVLITGSLLAILGVQVGALGIFSTVAVDPIREPRDPITGWTTDHFRLEHGTALGLLILLFSGLQAIQVSASWVSSGTLPGIETVTVLLASAIVGLQTIFSSFFLSSLLE